MSRLKSYINNLKENLRRDSVEECSLYRKGVGSVVVPKAGMKFDFIEPGLVSIVEGRKPQVSQTTKEIIEARTPNPKVNNPMPSLDHFSYSGGRIIFELYLGSFKEWRGTLPLGDEFDELLIREDLMTPFNTTAIPITKDGYVIFPERGERASHSNVLCGLNGYRLDRDVGENIIKCQGEIIKDGTGRELIRQSIGCVSTQLNIPEDKVINSQLMGMFASEPSLKDYGYHTLHLAKLDLDKKEVIDAANEIYGDNKHLRYQRITDRHVFPFDSGPLIKLANEAPEIMAITQVPLIWMSLAISFGENYLEKIKGLERR